MKNHLPPAAIGGILAAVVALAGIGLFLGLRDAPATTKVDRSTDAKSLPPLEDKPMPEWARQKLKDAESAQR